MMKYSFSINIKSLYLAEETPPYSQQVECTMYAEIGDKARQHETCLELMVMVSEKTRS